MAPTAAWKTLPLTSDVIQTALTAVGYKTNYARTITSRFCLHYINSIRSRESSGIVSYLFSVDGCESSQVVSGGRCDIYNCKPYTYEVQLSQKSTGSSDYGVVSLTKTLDQKSVNDIRGEDSNLDIYGVGQPVYAIPPEGAEPTVGAEEPTEEPVLILPPDELEIPIPPPDEPKIPVVQTPPPPEGEAKPYIVLPPLPEGAIVVPGRPDLVGALETPAPPVSVQANPVPPTSVQAIPVSPLTEQSSPVLPAYVPNYPVPPPQEVSVQTAAPLAWPTYGNDAPLSDQEDDFDWVDDGGPEVSIDDVQWTSEDDPDTSISDEEPSYEWGGSSELEYPIQTWDSGWKYSYANNWPELHAGNEGLATWTAGGALETPTEDAQPVGEEPNVPFGEDEPVDWPGDGDNNFLLDSQPLSTKLPDVQPMSLRADATTSLVSQPGRFVGAASGFAPVVAVVRVAMAVVVVRLRGRKRTVSEEHTPLRSADTTTVEPTVSEDSKTSTVEADLESA